MIKQINLQTFVHPFRNFINTFRGKFFGFFWQHKRLSDSKFSLRNINKHNVAFSKCNWRISIKLDVNLNVPFLRIYQKLFGTRASPEKIITKYWCKKNFLEKVKSKWKANWNKKSERETNCEKHLGKIYAK